MLHFVETVYLFANAEKRFMYRINVTIKYICHIVRKLVVLGTNFFFEFRNGIFQVMVVSYGV